ncbi:MAG TPA: efflux RND transporter permease subunit [bacterium]|nr:efflux RND transporter permease subunit [bacterium]
MSLPELGVKRPVTTLAVFTIILILGFISLTQVGIDLMPDITLPAISITTIYPGAGPEDVEQQLTKLIEDAVVTAPNVNKVESVSMENISNVIVYLNWGTDVDQASVDIRDALGFVGPFMPRDARDPLFFKFDASAMPIMFLGLSAKESYADLYEIADREIGGALARLPGVGAASAYGGLKRRINVRVNGAALTARGLTIDQVTRMLQAANLTLPAGRVEIGRREYVIRLPGEFRTVDEISGVVIGYSQRGTPIHLRDVADVEDGFAEIQRYTRMDGVPAVMMIIQKQAGANTVEVADAVWNKLEEIRPTLPGDIQIRKVFDGSTFIKQSIASLARTILWAALLIVVVVLLFLRNLRSSFIIAFVLPFSMIVAFILLYFAGYTINIMSLSSLAIAIGMVVDNGIVVFENIFRHRTEYGEAAAESAIFGSREVAMAITASTLTTVVIFVPLLFVEGIAGILFRQLGYVIMFVLAASLFTALFLTPMLSSRFLKVDSGNSGGSGKGLWSRRFYQWSERGFQAVESAYRNILGWALKHRKTTMAVGVGIFAVSLAASGLMKTEFFPQADESELNGTIKMPIGTSLEETNRMMFRIEEILNGTVPEKDVIMTRCGTSEAGWGAAMGEGEGNHIISIQGTLVPKAERNASDVEIAHRLGEQLRELPGIASVDFAPQDPFTAMFGGGKPVSVEIYGFDLDRTSDFAAQVAEVMRNIEGTTDITVSREEGKPEYWVEVDRERAAAAGLTMAQIAMTLRNNFYGNDEVTFREQGEEYAVFVRLQEKDRTSLADIGNVMLASPAGALIPLRTIATIQERVAPVQINRKNQDRTVTVGCGIIGRALGSVAADLRRELAALDAPNGVEYVIAGSVEEQASSFRDLGLAMLLGVVLVYLVMAAQFESLVDPFVIMFAIPFAIVGVIWAMIITDTTFSINAFIGLIMLVGIVVNNGIVLVDYINLMRARGLGVEDAVLTSGQRRLRPVLMTTLTTAFGLLPLALSRAEGSESWVPLGVAVIGGLLASTLITLVFVPTLYAIFEDRLKGRRVFGKLEG